MNKPHQQTMPLGLGELFAHCPPATAHRPPATEVRPPSVAEIIAFPTPQPQPAPRPGLAIIPPKPKAKARSETFAQIKVSDAVRNVLGQLTITNGAAILPPLDRKLYVETLKVLETIGAAWVKKKKHHEFPPDAEEKLNAILGRGFAIDEQKLTQFYQTPDPIAERMVDLAGIAAEHDVLEPSAGAGAILFRLHAEMDRLESTGALTAVELDAGRAKELHATAAMLCPARPPLHVYQGDFLDFEGRQFDRIIANPPFRGQQDIQHVQHMLRLLKPGGRIIAITAPGWETSQSREARDFRSGLEKLEWSAEELPAGTFRDSGTDVRAILLTIDKPAAAPSQPTEAPPQASATTPKSAWGSTGFATLRNPGSSFDCIQCGRETLNTIDPADYNSASIEPVAVCVECVNTQASYQAALGKAKKIWSKTEPATNPVTSHPDYSRAVLLSSYRSEDVTRDETIALIRTGLKLRTGKRWSVTGGSGTVYGWIDIAPLPKDRPADNTFTPEQADTLRQAMGIERVFPHSSVSIPSGSDYYREHIARAWGIPPTFIGKPYWD